MNKIIQKIINYILQRRRSRLEQTLNTLKPRTYTNSTTKTHINASETLTITARTKQLLQTINVELINIVKTCETNPDKIIDFIIAHGTKVYIVRNAKNFLTKINEQPGFISPLSGIKAFYLNLWTGLFCEKRLNFSFKTKDMFILDSAEINIYFILHQFYLWYGFKKGLPGYDETSRELLKSHIDAMSDADVNKMSVEQILGFKEAIARDKEAADFVIQLAKQSTGAKQALEKIQKNGGANI